MNVKYKSKCLLNSNANLIERQLMSYPHYEKTVVGFHLLFARRHCSNNKEKFSSLNSYYRV